MKILVALMIISLFNYGLDAAPAASKSLNELCPLGLVYANPRVDCQTCECNPDNGVVSCTRMACETRLRPDEIATAGSKALKTSEPRHELCPHGTTWNVNCNVCFCYPDTGFTGCSMMACSTDQIQPAETKSLMKTSETNHELCPHGTTWNVNCNVCFCYPDTGFTGCSMMACSTDQVQPAETKSLMKTSEPHHELCPHGTTWNVNCNVCFCYPDTGFTGCSMMACSTDQVRPATKSLKYSEAHHELCPLGYYFPAPDGCNMCSCNPLNGYVGCSTMTCVTTVAPPPPAEVARKK